jgi:hypothetical protein
MEKQCAICQKKSTMAWKLKKLRGKFNPTKKYRKYPNLQWALVPVGMKKESYKKFSGRRVLACTKCIKAIGKSR